MPFRQNSITSPFFLNYSPLILFIMSSIFEKLNIYASKWALTSSRSFSSEELSVVKSAVVVDSDYGKSVCFFMKSGGKTYLPLSTESSLVAGEEVDLSTAKIITLSKSGESDIMRVEP